MTNKETAVQPEALLLADVLEQFGGATCFKAAAELRRLHQSEREGWRYADELKQDLDRLRAQVEALSAAQAGVPAEQTPELQRMTAHRAIYFMERFLKEEKLLGPNEQAALHFAIAMLAAAPQPVVREPLTDEAARKQGATMSRDEIIAMAKEAGFEWSGIGFLDRMCFERFAALVAAAEREACAAIGDRTFKGKPGQAVNCAVASAIRARGQHG